MKVGRLLKYESREVCTTRLHEESFASYLAISISAKYLAQTVGGDFIILAEYARFKRILLVSNWFRAFLLELPKRYVEIFSSRRIEKTDINRLWNAWIRRRRKQLFDPRWSRYTTSSFFANSSVRGWRRVGAKFRDAWFVWLDRLYLQWQTVLS